MKICIFVKQVPAVEDVKVDKEKGTLIRDGVESKINPYDLNAVELGLQLKDDLGADVVIATMGPPQAKDILLQAISMGADSGYLISDRSFAGSDAWATSIVLSSFIKHIKDVDLIICGNYSVDGETGQVGPETAELLSIPALTYVTKLEEATSGSITVRRHFETADLIFNTTYPALLTVGKDVNTPRLPSFGGMMKAKKAEIEVLSAVDLGIDPALVGAAGSPTKVIKVFESEITTHADLIDGSALEQATKLASILKEQGYAN